MDYQTDSKRWRSVLSIVKWMLIVTTIINIILSIISVLASQYIAMYIFAIFVLFQIILLQNTKKALEEEDLKVLYFPFRICVLMLGMLY